MYINILKKLIEKHKRVSQLEIENRQEKIKKYKNDLNKTIEEKNLWDKSRCTEQFFRAFYDGNLWEIYRMKKSPLWRTCCFVKKSGHNENICGTIHTIDRFWNNLSLALDF